VAGPKCEIVEIPTSSRRKTALPKIILEVKFTDGIEVSEEMLKPLPSGWKPA
jgi:hypothetical protein